MARRRGGQGGGRIGDLGGADAGLLRVGRGIGHGRRLEGVRADAETTLLEEGLGDLDRLALGAQAGEARLRSVVTDGGFSRFRRAAETPFNIVYEARP